MAVLELLNQSFGSSESDIFTDDTGQVFVEVDIGSVISPADFLISPVRKIPLSEKISRIRKIEWKLSERGQSLERFSGRAQDLAVSVGPDEWRRGRFMEYLPGGKFKVSLCDLGKIVEVEKASVFLLPVKYSQYPPLNQRFQIKDIRPKKMQYGKEKSDWSRTASKLVLNLVSLAENTYIRLDKSCINNPDMYTGDIIIVFGQTNPNYDILANNKKLEKYRLLLGNATNISISHVLLEMGFAEWTDSDIGSSKTSSSSSVTFHTASEGTSEENLRSISPASSSSLSMTKGEENEIAAVFHTRLPSENKENLISVKDESVGKRRIPQKVPKWLIDGYNSSTEKMDIQRVEGSQNRSDLEIQRSQIKRKHMRREKKPLIQNLRAISSSSGKDSPSQVLSEIELVENEISLDDLKNEMEAEKNIPNEGQREVRKEKKGREYSKIMNKPTQLLVHQDTGSRSIKLIEATSDLEWHPYLSLFFGSSSITTASLVQNAMWPAISRLKSVVSVSGPNSGRTYGWIFPILNCILSDDYEMSNNDLNPNVVVIAPSWLQVQNIYMTVQAIVDQVDGQAAIKVVPCFREREKDKVALFDLLNGSHIVVATLPSLLRQLQENTPLALTNCKHLVFEVAEELFEIFTEEIVTLMKILHLQKKKMGREENVQKIVVTSKWSTAVEQFVKSYMFPVGQFGPVLIFSSFLEAAIYGKVKSFPHLFGGKEEKITVLNKILNDCQKTDKVLILCSEWSVATTVYAELKELKWNSFVIHEKLHLSEASDTLEAWRESDENDYEWRCKPLIITDLYCFDNVTDAQVLIHYDVPEASKKLFSERYSHARDNFESIYSNNNLDKSDNSNHHRSVESHIFLTKGDESKLKTIVGFLRSSHSEIPLELRTLYIRRQILDASAKVHTPICENLKLFGHCQEKLTTCPERHFLEVEVDSVNKYLRGGPIINFNVTHIYSPVRFQAHVCDVLMEHGKVKAGLGKDKYNLAIKLAMLKKVEPLVEPMRGSVCLAHDQENCLKRVEILNIAKNKEVEVLFIDQGTCALIKCSKLFKIPDNLSPLHFPHQTFEVILCGLAPHDKDRQWDLSTILTVNEMLKPDLKERERFVCRGKVAFRFGNTLFLDELRCLKSAKENREFYPFHNIKQVLARHHAETNQDHLRRIKSLLPGHSEDPQFYPDQDGDLIRKVDPKETIPIPTVNPLLFRFLDDTKNYSLIEADSVLLGSKVKIIVTEVFSPNLFFVRLNSKSEKLCALEKEITQYLKSEGVEKLCLADFKPEFDDVCLARYSAGDLNPDLKEVGGEEENMFQDYLRARVVKTFSGGPDQKRMFEIFFVDYGYTRTLGQDAVCQIPRRFVTALPFQAIECELSDVLPFPPPSRRGYSRIKKNSSFSKEAGDVLFELTCQENESGVPPIIWANFLFDGIPSTPTLKKKFKVELLMESFDGQEEEVCVASILVDKNLAIYNHDFDVVVSGMRDVQLKDLSFQTTTSSSLSSTGKENPKNCNKDGEDDFQPKQLETRRIERPEGIPFPAFVKGLTARELESRIPRVNWAFASNNCLALSINKPDLNEAGGGGVFDFYLKVTSNSLKYQSVSVMTTDSAVSAHWIVYDVPDLNLCNLLNPNQTEVKETERVILIKLHFLRRYNEMDYPFVKKFPWLKVDHSCYPNNSDDKNNNNEDDDDHQKIRLSKILKKIQQDDLSRSDPETFKVTPKPEEWISNSSEETQSDTEDRNEDMFDFIS